MDRYEQTCSLGLIRLPFCLDPILPLSDILHVPFVYSQEMVEVQKLVYVRLRLRKALQIRQDPSRVRFSCKGFLELFTAIRRGRSVLSGRFCGKGGGGGSIGIWRALVDLREY